ncbi:hypothetical protein ACFL6S_21070 [Candidatus Poribacteria bacterium]
MSEHSGSTDQVHEIKLTSVISQAVWDRPVASVGQQVEVQVYTQFVGNGSEIRISIHNKSGRRLDRIEGKVYGNWFKSIYTIPEKAKEAIYFEAELRKHGLKKKSEEMKVIPPIIITNVQWSQQEARRGDILKLTADVKDAPEEAEAVIEIYEHDADDAHDFITKFPVVINNNKIETEWEYEYHEDTDDIPTAEETEKGYNPPEYFFRVKIWQYSADSGLLTFKDWVEIDLLDEEGIPMADVKFTLYLPDGSERSGQLDANGYARVEDVPPGRTYVEFPDVQSLELVMPEEAVDTTNVIDDTIEEV